MMRLAGVEDDEYDALADLFLGDGELAPEVADEAAPAPAAPPPDAPEEPEAPAPIGIEAPRIEGDGAPGPGRDPASSRPAIEMLMLGHLPVRAALWVRQYACSVASRCDERVALARVVGGTVSIDLINAPEAPIDRRALGDEPLTLARALGIVCAHADRVILRVDETTEPEIVERDEVDALTILTGADEAAIVSSYRLIKSVTGAWEAGDPVGSPRLRLAVMGATDERAAQASVKLTRAVDAFLDRPIEIIDAAGRIDATATQNLYQRDGSGADAAGSILDTIVEVGRDAPATDAPALDGGPPAEPVCDPPEPVSSARTRVARATPAPPAMYASDTALCDLLVGVARLETRCPHAPGVELGVDEAGRLHMVTSDDHADAAVQLEAARAWVRDHLDLLIRAEPRVAIPDAARGAEPAVSHLLAANPPAWRGLIDSGVKLHALATARVGDRVARVATPIN